MLGQIHRLWRRRLEALTDTFEHHIQGKRYLKLLRLFFFPRTTLTPPILHRSRSCRRRKDLLLLGGRHHHLNWLCGGLDRALEIHAHEHALKCSHGRRRIFKVPCMSANTLKEGFKPIPPIALNPPAVGLVRRRRHTA